VVLDASALLALLLDERGAEASARALDEGHAVVCAANLAEVVARLALLGSVPRSIREALGPLDLNVIEVDEDLAYRAGLMAPDAKTLGLSLGDRCCLALAERERGTVLTADRVWLKWKGKAKVVCIR
jgi:PIN domain nuclease of toxin-antitoxin system